LVLLDAFAAGRIAAGAAAAGVPSARGAVECASVTNDATHALHAVKPPIFSNKYSRMLCRRWRDALKPDRISRGGPN